MKRNDLIILGALGIGAFLLFSRKSSATQDTTSSVGGGGGFSLPDFSSMFDFSKLIPAPVVVPLPNSAGTQFSYDLGAQLGKQYANLAQQLTQQTQAAVVAAQLPKQYGSYTPNLFANTYTYTSPQGYQMSVAPQNVQAVANKFVAQQQSAASTALTTGKQTAALNPLFAYIK